MAVIQTIFKKCTLLIDEDDHRPPQDEDPILLNCLFCSLPTLSSEERECTSSQDHGNSPGGKVETWVDGDKQRRQDTHGCPLAVMEIR